MVVRIGINGFGRIGRDYLRYVAGAEDLDVVAVNDVMDSASMSRLLRRDSTFGAASSMASRRQNRIKQGKGEHSCARRNNDVLLAI